MLCHYHNSRKIVRDFRNRNASGIKTAAKNGEKKLDIQYKMSWLNAQNKKFQHFITKKILLLGNGNYLLWCGNEPNSEALLLLLHYFSLLVFQTLPWLHSCNFYKVCYTGYEQYNTWKCFFICLIYYAPRTLCHEEFHSG